MPEYAVQDFERVSLTSISPGRVHPHRFTGKSAARRLARRLLRHVGPSNGGVCVVDEQGAAIWWSDTDRGAGAPWLRDLEGFIRGLSAP